MSIPLGPVVQSIVSLKSFGRNSLSLTVHTKLIAVIFFAEKLLEAFAQHLTFYQQNARVVAYYHLKI